MNPNTFLFSDGRSAFLNQSSLEEEEFQSLPASAIPKLKWIPAFLLMLTGIALIVMGLLNWLPKSIYEWLSISESYEINSILILGGVSIVVIAAMTFLLMRKQYIKRVKASKQSMKGSVYMSRQ